VADYLNRGHLALAEHDDRGAPMCRWSAGIFARSPLLPMLAPSVDSI
jgi:hypothetical protein